MRAYKRNLSGIPTGPSYLGHNGILALADVLSLRFHDGLQELKVMHVAPVGLYAMHKMVDDALCDLVAQLDVVLEDGAHRLCLVTLQKRAYFIFCKCFLDMA